MCVCVCVRARAAMPAKHSQPSLLDSFRKRACVVIIQRYVRQCLPSTCVEAKILRRKDLALEDLLYVYINLQPSINIYSSVFLRLVSSSAVDHPVLIDSALSSSLRGTHYTHFHCDCVSKYCRVIMSAQTAPSAATTEDLRYVQCECELEARLIFTYSSQPSASEEPSYALQSYTEVEWPAAPIVEKLLSGSPVDIHHRRIESELKQWEHRWMVASNTTT
ncbi:hypothetical protein F5Y15DRAFT_83881 [Xylariaceae sp. FL0016]|nr:hypothetical protein F5Y15DRAFT_83881 [Xylariaceae sp. FL0016]